MINGLRIAAVAEALTLLALVFIAVPLKHLGGLPVATSIMGPIHGAAFLFFLWCLVRSKAEGLISLPDTIRLAIGAFIPFGGIVNERWLKRKFAEQGHTL